MIGDVLKQILNEKNVNVNELAEKIGVSNQTLYSIIKRNNMKVDFSVLLKICNALSVDISRFYCDYISKDFVEIDNHDEKTKKHINLFSQLSDSGKEKVIDYTEMVYSSEQNGK